MAFMTYEDTPFQNLQDQSGLRAAFNLARDLHESLALKSDKAAEALQNESPNGTPVVGGRSSYEKAFKKWIEGQVLLTSLPDLSADIKARAVIVELLEGTFIMAHNDHEKCLEKFGPLFTDMRAAAASSTSSAFLGEVITEIEQDKLTGENPVTSVAQTEYRILDTLHTLRSAMRYAARGEVFRNELNRTTIHPAEYKNWTKTIEGFDKRGADGIPPSLYSQTDAAVNILRFMKTQFTPDVK